MDIDVNNLRTEVYGGDRSKRGNAQEWVVRVDSLFLVIVGLSFQPDPLHEVRHPSRRLLTKRLYYQCPLLQHPCNFVELCLRVAFCILLLSIRLSLHDAFAPLHWQTKKVEDWTGCGLRDLQQGLLQTVQIQSWMLRNGYIKCLCVLSFFSWLLVCVSPCRR